MVEAHVTTLGSLTLAIDQGRFLLEDPLSDSIVSLYPAVAFSDNPRPQSFEEVEGFSAGDDMMRVVWAPKRDIQVATTLVLIEALHLELKVKVTNVGDLPVGLSAVHPIHLPADGPGACALGVHELRTFASPRAGRPPRLMPVHGKGISTEWGGIYFASGGNPALVIGALASAEVIPRIVVDGVRGRILSLSIHCPLGEFRLEPGESLETVPFLLALGRLDVRQELHRWRSRLGDSPRVVPLCDFDPAGEVAQPEPESESERPPEDEPGERIAGVAKPDAGTVPNVPLQTPTGHGTAVLRSPVCRPGDASRGGAFRGMTRCAAFRRALRVAEGLWPRWATGRRYAPVSGIGGRARRAWRAQRRPA